VEVSGGKRLLAQDLLLDDDSDDDVSASTSDHFDRDDISLNLQLSTSCRDEEEKAAAKEGRGPTKRRQQLDISPDIIIIDVERLSSGKRCGIFSFSLQSAK